MHNIILDTSYNTGLIGLVLLSSIFFIILKRSWKSRHIPLEEGIFYSTIAILANSMLDMPLFGTEVAALFYFLAGIALIREKDTLR
jgi:O-antigen ligase